MMMNILLYFYHQQFALNEAESSNIWFFLFLYKIPNIQWLLKFVLINFLPIN